VALVFSPGTGEENRRRLQQWVQSRLSQAQGQVQTKAGELQNKAQQAASQGADWATARATEVRDKAQDVAKSASETAQGVVNKESNSGSAQDTATETVEGTIPVVPEDHAVES